MRLSRDVSFRFLWRSLLPEYRGTVPVYPRHSSISAYPLQQSLFYLLTSVGCQRAPMTGASNAKRCVGNRGTDSVGLSTCRRGSSLADALGVTIAREREEEKGEKEIGRERDRPTAAEVQRRRSGWAVHTGYYWLVSRLAADWLRRKRMKPGDVALTPPQGFTTTTTTTTPPSPPPPPPPSPSPPPDRGTATERNRIGPCLQPSNRIPVLNIRHTKNTCRLNRVDDTRVNRTGHDDVTSPVFWEIVNFNPAYVLK